MIRGIASPALLCHKEPAQGTQSPLLGALGRNAVKFFFMYHDSLQLNSNVDNQMSWIINVKELRHNDRFDSKKVSESQRD